MNEVCDELRYSNNCLRSLCEKAVPGNRVTVIGVYSIQKAAAQGRGKNKGAIGVRMPYLRVIGVQARNYE